MIVDRVRAATGPFVVSLLVLAPLLATSIPPLYDYPNHLARMRILAGGDPALAAMFGRSWALYPNLAMDLIVPPLARLLPLAVAGRVFIGVVMLVCVAGTVCLHRAAFRDRSPWPWISALTAFNAVLTMGLLNYLAGIGCAMLGAALHLLIGEQRPALRTAAAGAFGLLCLVCHLFGFALFALLLTSIEVAPAWDAVRRRRWPTGLLSVIVAVALPLGLYRLFGPTRSYVDPATLAAAWTQIKAHGLGSGMRDRMLWLAGAFATPGGPFHIVSGALAGGLVLAGLARWRLIVARSLAPAVLALLAAFVLLPATLADNGMVYQRLGVPLVLLGLASVSPQLGARFVRAAVFAGAGLLVVISGAVAWRWSGQNALLADVRAVIATIPAGARVLAVRDGAAPWSVDAAEPASHRVFYRGIAYAHLAALVTLDRDAFWPMIFAQGGKQPVRVRAAYASLLQNDGYLPRTAQLSGGPGVPPQLARWRQRYDYLLRLDATSPGLPDPALRLVASNGFAALYEVRLGAAATVVAGLP